MAKITNIACAKVSTVKSRISLLVEAAIGVGRIEKA